MTCWKAIRSFSNSTNVFSIPVQSYSEVSTITVTTRQAKCFLKMTNCTVQLWPFQYWLNSIMLAKFLLMFLIKFFNYSTEMHSYNTRFAFSRNFVVNSILQECRSYAKFWSSISPDVRRLPKFKFRKTLGHCLIKIVIQEDGCVAMIRIVTIILWLPAYVYSYFQKRYQKKREHPISLDRKAVWVVSPATGDLCYMMPALLTSFKNSNIILQSWLMLFFWNVFWSSCICMIYVMCIYVLSAGLGWSVLGKTVPEGKVWLVSSGSWWLYWSSQTGSLIWTGELSSARKFLDQMGM